MASEQIGAAGESALDMNAVAGDGLGDTGGGGILGDVAGSWCLSSAPAVPDAGCGR